MKVGYTIESVIALAFGAGVWWCMYRTYPFDPGPQTWGSFIVDWVLMRGFVFLAGASLIGGLGLVVESLRGRSPDPWGGGRWIWAIAALSTVVSLIHYGFIYETNNWHDFWGLAVYVTSGWGDLTGYLIGLRLTASLLGLPKAPRADAREWTGRILGALMVVLTVIETTQHLWMPGI